MPSLSFRLLASLGAVAAFILPGAAFAACTSPSAPAGKILFNSTYKVMQYCNGTDWVNTGAVISGAAQTGCSSPTAGPGGVVYNKTLGVIQFCNGSSWVDTACAASRTPGGSGCTGPTGTAGAIHYETSSNELQFCDSTNWVAMGWPCAATGGGGGGGGGGSTDWSTAGLTQTIGDYWPYVVQTNTALLTPTTTDPDGNSYFDIFTKASGTWTQRFTFPQTGSTADMDSGTVAIGLYGDGGGKGAVYVYTGSGASWSQQGSKLVGTGATTSTQLGNVVAINKDTIAAFGGAADVYIFTRSAGVWSQQAKIPTGLTAATTLSLDNDTLAVGSPSNVTNNGAVQIYTRSGTTWTLQTTINGPTWPGPTAPDNFGYAVVLRGSTLAIAAPFDTNARGSHAGALYIYTGSGASWAQQAKLIPSDLNPDDNFGLQLSLSGDTVVAGATSLLSLFAGYTGAASASPAVYVYTRSGTSWTQARKYLASVPNPTGFGLYAATDATTVMAADLVDDTYANGATAVFGP